MTSYVFSCSKQRAVHLTQEVLRELRFTAVRWDSTSAQLKSQRGWSFMRPPQELDIQMHQLEHGMEVVVECVSKVPALDFGRAGFLEEEVIHRLRDRIGR